MHMKAYAWFRAAANEGREICLSHERNDAHGNRLADTSAVALIASHVQSHEYQKI